MPLTFIDIERQKNWRIGLFFLVLLLFYLLLAVLLAATFLLGPLPAGPRFWVFLLAAAFTISALHFWFASSDTVRTIEKTLDARQPDAGDDVHRVFINIMAELHVVTGNRRMIRGVVIPSLSLNALAAADLKGNAVIGITEGLLSRLTRPQLEAVLAHEAHHVLAGDCLETTVATSLFGTASAAVEKIGQTSQGRAFASPPFLLAWLLLQLSNLLRLFISREREYRADAASVRMTRNPVALAEALHLLSWSWRGAGFIGSGLEMLCIVSPRASALDEAEGVVPDLLSTHPPLRKRIDILLAQARVSVTDLERKASMRENAGADRADRTPAYFALSPRQEWQGPLTVAELAALPWLSPLTWITAGPDAAVDRAWKDPLISPLFIRNLAKGEQAPSSYACPLCRQPLLVESCEGTRVFQCRFCAGMLVETDKVRRIIARADRPCTDRIAALARSMQQENRIKQAQRKLSGRRYSVAPPLLCPKCANAMHRSFYSLTYLVEIDRCSFCDLAWFDQDELALLQCMVANRITGELPHAVTPGGPL